MNLASIRTRALDHLGDRNQDVFTDSLLKRWINSAYLAIYRELLEKTDLLMEATVDKSVTVSDTDVEFSLPSDVDKIHSVEMLVTGSSPIPHVCVPFRDRYSDTVSSPKYYIRAGYIGFPAPSEDYTARVHYTSIPADLSGDSDVPAIPARYHQLIALEAAQRAKASMNEELNPMAAAEYQREWSNLRNDANVRNDQTPRYVRYLPEE